jgi:hypothetical protein
MNPEIDQSEAGFSLVEAMVASVVLVVGLVGLLQLLAVATIAHSDARQATAATLLAQSKIDQLMKTDFSASSVALGGGIVSNIANYFDVPEPGITRRWSIATGPVAGTRLLTVKVENKGARVYGREQQLTTIIRDW